MTQKILQALPKNVPTSAKFGMISCDIAIWVGQIIFLEAFAALKRMTSKRYTTKTSMFKVFQNMSIDGK